MVSKPQVVFEGSVAIGFEMLTYLKYAPLSKPIDALPSNTTWGFETTSIPFQRYVMRVWYTCGNDYLLSTTMVYGGVACLSRTN